MGILKPRRKGESLLLPLTIRYAASVLSKNHSVKNLIEVEVIHFCFEQNWYVRYNYQLHQIDIMVSHRGTLLYWTGMVTIVLSHHIDNYFMVVTIRNFVYTL